MSVTESILQSTKKALNIDPEDDAFDPDIIMHLNSVFADMHQLGIGPENGYEIFDATETWTDFLGLADMPLNNVKSYVYLRVRLIFDPPTSSFGQEAFQKQADKLEWRINAYREGKVWIPPVTEADPEESPLPMF